MKKFLVVLVLGLTFITGCGKEKEKTYTESEVKAMLAEVQKSDEVIEIVEPEEVVEEYTVNDWASAVAATQQMYGPEVANNIFSLLDGLTAENGYTVRRVLVDTFSMSWDSADSLVTIYEGTHSVKEVTHEEVEEPVEELEVGLVGDSLDDMELQYVGEVYEWYNLGWVDGQCVGEDGMGIYTADDCDYFTVIFATEDGDIECPTQFATLEELAEYANECANRGVILW